MTSALRALKSLFQAFEFEIKDEREPLHKLVEHFFPVIEQLIGTEAVTNSPNYIPIMILVSKIFFMSIQVSIPFICQRPECDSKHARFF